MDEWMGVKRAEQRGAEGSRREGKAQLIAK